MRKHHHQGKYGSRNQLDIDAVADSIANYHDSATLKKPLWLYSMLVEDQRIDLGHCAASALTHYLGVSPYMEGRTELVGHYLTKYEHPTEVPDPEEYEINLLNNRIIIASSDIEIDNSDYEEPLKSLLWLPPELRYQLARHGRQTGIGAYDFPVHFMGHNYDDVDEAVKHGVWGFRIERLFHSNRIGWSLPENDEGDGSVRLDTLPLKTWGFRCTLRFYAWVEEPEGLPASADKEKSYESALSALGESWFEGVDTLLEDKVYYENGAWFATIEQEFDAPICAQIPFDSNNTVANIFSVEEIAKAIHHAGMKAAQPLLEHVQQFRVWCKSLETEFDLKVD